MSSLETLQAMAFGSSLTGHPRVVAIMISDHVNGPDGEFRCDEPYLATLSGLPLAHLRACLHDLEAIGLISEPDPRYDPSGRGDPDWRRWDSDMSRQLVRDGGVPEMRAARRRAKEAQ